jgi:uncharacterized protein (PEP-CTERM system associated)
MATATGMDMAMTFNVKIIRPVSLLFLCYLSNPATSQQATIGGGTIQTSGWVVKPRVTFTETLTDNVNINRSNGGEQEDLITQIAPGVRIEARTSRLKAYFDYALQGQFYAKTNYSRTQNSLNTFGTFEAVDKWLFFDFSGVISQQTISAFGAQSPSNSTINNNSTETANYRISPYIRGQLGGAVEYLLRYNLSTLRSDASVVSDTNIAEWIGQLRGGTPFQNLKWTIDASQRSTDYSRGRDNDADRVRALLTYTILPQFKVSVSGGQETNNYASLNQETYTTNGYGFDWNPTERTRISVFKESRFFGDGHNVSFSHRFPRSSIRFTDTRDVSVLPNQYTSVGLGTVYDSYFQIFSNIEPYASMNPATKDTAVDTAVNAFLANSGISPNTQATSSFLTSRATIRRNQSLALALTGVRNSVTLVANRTESQSVLAATASNDDFSQSTLVQQQGFSLNLSHRISELSNLNALASRQESKGSSNVTGNSNLKTTTTTYQINSSTKLGARTTGSLSVRRSEFDSTSNPFTENALIGTISFIY